MATGPQKVTRALLRKMDERPETDEEATQRIQFAKKVYDNNLTKLASCLCKKGAWRIQVNDVGEIIEVSRGAGRKLCPGEFTVIVSGAGDPPRFGKLDHLSLVQERVVETMKGDVRKIASAREVALSTPGRGDVVVDKLVNEHLSQLEARFGELPKSKTEIEEEKRRREIEYEQVAGWIEGEQKLGKKAAAAAARKPMTIEEMLEKEEKKRLKRQRQKERRRREQKEEAAKKATATGEAIEPNDDKDGKEQAGGGKVHDGVEAAPDVQESEATDAVKKKKKKKKKKKNPHEHGSETKDNVTAS